MGEQMEPLSNIDPAPTGSKEAIASGMIDGLLDLILNRHIHVLEENGYLKSKKYHSEYGWDGPKKKKALRLKHELIDEAILRFRSRFAEQIKEPIQPPQPTTDSSAVSRG